jgi:hypothetical protein
MKNLWRPGGLFDTIDKFASSLGHENAALVMKFAMIPWNSVEDRDRFIASITGEPPKGGTTTNYISLYNKGH